MSYEGRSIYICPNGHITVFDAYEDYGYECLPEEDRPTPTKKEKFCQYCGEPLKYVGGVDDTNGESVASFRKICVYPGFTETVKSGSGAEIEIVTHMRPPCYRIEKAPDEDTFYNYDTGEEYKWQ